MGQAVSKAPAAGAPTLADVVQAKEAMLAYALLWHGAPPQKGADALAVPAVPLYDSDDETTDSAVISALAMTDPADLSSYRASMDRRPSVHAPILAQPMRAKAPSSQPPRPAATAAAGQPGNSSKQVAAAVAAAAAATKRPRYKDSTMTAAAAAAAATAAAAAAAAIARQAGVGIGRSRQQQQQPGRYQPNKLVVPLSAAALDAVGAPCRIGGDLPPESLQSHRGSGADVVGLRPLHHLHMMQQHRQRQQQQQQQQNAQAVCAQAQSAQWGWQVQQGTLAAQIAT